MSNNEPSATTSQPLPIGEIAGDLALDESAFEPYGRYAAKLSPDLQGRLVGRSIGKYVGVTAVSPTPLGEGKTVVAIGLAMALSRIGSRSIVTLREPSLAPVFGIKGGGAGGGRARVLPQDDINLHFTGDLHAVSSANNLLAAMLDNHCRRALNPAVDAKNIDWRRVVDMSDKGLAHIETGLVDSRQAPRRQTGFDLTAASEVMSILALATNLSDMRERLGRIIVSRDTCGKPVSAEDIGAAGAMAALLRLALRPNLVQTSEHTPAIVHAGPFANISHGNSSVAADLLALKLADFVVTESGFGSDLGAEKFFDIKCRASGLRPDVEVLVCTARALKYQSGRFDVRPGRPLPEEMLSEDVDALRTGSVNLAAHLGVLRAFGVPTVVAINHFPSDTDTELQRLAELARDLGAEHVAVVNAFDRGGDGARELAERVVTASTRPNGFDFLYPLDASIEEKLQLIATRIYGADAVVLDRTARIQVRQLTDWGYGGLPVCVAKTQYSLSHDPKLLGRPRGFRLPIRELRLAAGAGFLLALTEGVNLMPGLPKVPAATRIDVQRDGTIVGIR